MHNFGIFSAGSSNLQIQVETRYLTDWVDVGSGGGGEGKGKARNIRKEEKGATAPISVTQLHAGISCDEMTGLGRGG